MQLRVFRSEEVHKDKAETWDNIPQHLAHMEDCSAFVQFSTVDLQIFFSSKTVKVLVQNLLLSSRSSTSINILQKAYENGLFALVSDGVHKMLPHCLGDNSQLYTIHGVCRNGEEVITKKVSRSHTYGSLRI